MISQGSWSIAFTHWEVYRARAINVQLCGKAQLTEHMYRQRFCSMLRRDEWVWA